MKVIFLIDIEVEEGISEKYPKRNYIILIKLNSNSNSWGQIPSNNINLIFDKDYEKQKDP